MEDSPLQHGAAPSRLPGFLSIVAVRLLQVETLARTVSTLPANRAVDHALLAFPCRRRQRDPASMTVQEFWREVARFGGFLARKHDGSLAGKPSGKDGTTSIPASRAISWANNVGNDKP